MFFFTPSFVCLDADPDHREKPWKRKTGSWFPFMDRTPFPFLRSPPVVFASISPNYFSFGQAGSWSTSKWQAGSGSASRWRRSATLSELCFAPFSSIRLVLPPPVLGTGTGTTCLIEHAIPDGSSLAEHVELLPVRTVGVHRCHSSQSENK